MPGWDWQVRAACRDVDGALFFHEENERGLSRTERDERAKRVCRSCPVIETCRLHAITTGEAYGVLGGMSEGERRGLARSVLASRSAPAPVPGDARSGVDTPDRGYQSTDGDG